MQFDTKSLWIYLYFPHLQLDLLEQQLVNSGAHNLPRGVYDAKANQIVQLNQQAQQKGLKLGMGLASASLLTSDFQVHEYNPKQEEKALIQTAHELYLVTSDIALDAPKGLFLRAQNMLNLYGGLDAYWQVLNQTLKHTGFVFHFASAYSVNVAKLLALHRFNRILDDKKQIENALKRCHLDKTDIDAKDLEKLARVGIKDINGLFAQPLSSLASRVSRFSINVISELRGESAAKLRFYYPPEHYQDDVELLYDIELVDRLLPILESLLGKFEQYLLVRNALSLQISITLHQRDADAVIESINSALPIYKARDWMDIIELKLEQLVLKSGVYAIELSCTKMEIADIAEGDFFTHKTTHVAKLTLISRLRAKLGEQQVKGLTYCPDFRPEKISQTLYHNLNEQITTSAASTTKLTALQKRTSDLKKQADKDIFEDRPGLLLGQPQILSEKVNILQGPERIVSGWWDTHAVQRDYYIAQNRQGQQMWVFKTGEQKWYVHGYFI